MRLCGRVQTAGLCFGPHDFFSVVGPCVAFCRVAAACLLVRTALQLVGTITVAVVKGPCCALVSTVCSTRYMRELGLRFLTSRMP